MQSTLQKETYLVQLQFKSKFDAEYRRFSVDLNGVSGFQALYALLERVHSLYNIPFVVQYVDPKQGDILPINNDKNFERACSVTKNFLRILIQRKGESYGEINGYSAERAHSHAFLLPKSPANTLRSMGAIDKPRRSDRANISLGSDFHLVSSILDVEIVPRTMRRVRLISTKDKPFGLHIRSGLTVRFTENGRETVPGCFVSRLHENGIAASTGLLAVDDEIIEVNGIEVYNKTVDQVTDMMIANSSNLVITVKPANQKHCLDLPSRLGQSQLGSNSLPGNALSMLPYATNRSRTTENPTPTLSYLAQRDRPHDSSTMPTITHRSARSGSAASKDSSRSSLTAQPSRTSSFRPNQMHEVERSYPLCPPYVLTASNGRHDLMVDDPDELDDDETGAGLITL